MLIIDVLTWKKHEGRFAVVHYGGVRSMPQNQRWHHSVENCNLLQKQKEKKRQYYDSYQDVVLRQCRKEILPAYGYTVFVHGRAKYLLSSVVQTLSMSYYLWKCMLKLGLLILSLILAFSLFLTPFPHSSDRKFSENVGKCCLFFLTLVPYQNNVLGKTTPLPCPLLVLICD